MCPISTSTQKKSPTYYKARGTNIFFLKKIVIYERAMLFFLVLYALLMYTYECTVHDLSLLCKTINLRTLSSLRVVSKKRFFRFYHYPQIQDRKHDRQFQK